MVTPGVSNSNSRVDHAFPGFAACDDVGRGKEEVEEDVDCQRDEEQGGGDQENRLSRRGENATENATCRVLDFASSKKKTSKTAPRPRPTSSRPPIRTRLRRIHPHPPAQSMGVDALWDPTVGTAGKHPLLLLQHQRRMRCLSTQNHDLLSHVTDESLPFRSTRRRTHHLAQVALLRSAWEQATHTFAQWTQDERSKRRTMATIPDAFAILKRSPDVHVTLPLPRLTDLLVALPKHAFLALLDQHPRLDSILAQPLFDPLFEARLVVDFSSRGRGGKSAGLRATWRERYLRFASLTVIVPTRTPQVPTVVAVHRGPHRGSHHGAHRGAQPSDRHLRPRRIRRLRKQ